eukprot:34910-Eustigmatos_ZCMA.PRE.1
MTGDGVLARHCGLPPRSGVHDPCTVGGRVLPVQQAHTAVHGATDVLRAGHGGRTVLHEHVWVANDGREEPRGLCCGGLGGADRWGRDADVLVMGGRSDWPGP